MKVELNLWFNRTSINGLVSINAGEHQYKFTHLVDINRFAERTGLEADEFIQLAEDLELDPDAQYALMEDNVTFVAYNKKQAYAHVFYDNKKYQLKFNKDYKKYQTKSPDASFNWISK